MMYAMIWLALIAAVLYLLYSGGYIAVQMKRAVLFAASVNGDRARFSGCTGYTRRILRVREGRVYAIGLDADVSRGAVEVEIQDRKGERLLRLDPMCCRAEIALERGAYRIVIRYRKASGKLSLTIQ